MLSHLRTSSLQYLTSPARLPTPRDHLHDITNFPKAGPDASSHRRGHTMRAADFHEVGRRGIENETAKTTIDCGPCQRSAQRSKNGRKSSTSFRDGSAFLRTI